MHPYTETRREIERQRKESTRHFLIGLCFVGLVFLWMVLWLCL